MKRLNCWEYKNCGREPEGINVSKQGVCPTAVSNQYNDLNKGQYAGRACWIIVGTYGTGAPTCEFAKKLKTCLYCDFLKYVNEQEGRDFILIPHKNVS